MKQAEATTWVYLDSPADSTKMTESNPTFKWRIDKDIWERDLEEVDKRIRKIDRGISEADKGIIEIVYNNVLNW